MLAAEKQSARQTILVSGRISPFASTVNDSGVQVNIRE